MIGKTLTAACAGFLCLTGSGCIVVHTSIWTEGAETLRIAPSGLDALKVKTHNGKISYDGQPGTIGATVEVTKKGGGMTIGQARAALDAIEVYSEEIGESRYKLGWRWRTLKHIGWQGHVSFAITGPTEIDLTAQTHNGRVHVEGVEGETQLLTHNGRVTVDAQRGPLSAETHNGSVNATYTGENIRLLTHNGSIKADLSRCGKIKGSVTTHNGGVDVIVGADTSAELKCSTHRGRVNFEPTITSATATRRRLVGTLGEGGGTLVLSTHNGSIKIRDED